MTLAFYNGIKTCKKVHPVAILSIISLYVISALQISMFSIGMIALPQIRIYYFPVNPYALIFFVSSVVVVHLLLHTDLKLPFRRVILPYGKYSLSIYLFHGFIEYYVINVFGLERPWYVYSILFVLVLPIILAICGSVEFVVNKISGVFIRKCASYIYAIGQ